MIPGADPGVQLYVRNKRPRDLATFSAENVVLFVHGATYPAETTFDLQLDGLSWMGYIAGRGYDVYMMDVRGYGKSSRPAEMNQPADRNPPIVRTETAARDYGAAVDFVLKRRGIPTGKKPMPDAWVEEWARATFASDPAGANGNPRFVRAPNGVVLDGREHWSAGKPLYDPANIRVPTMLILAEWDADTPVYMAQALFPKLVNAEPKRLVIIGEGTHGVMMEKNRMQLFREVQMFLEEQAPRP